MTDVQLQLRRFAYFPLQLIQSCRVVTVGKARVPLHEIYVSKAEFCI